MAPADQRLGANQLFVAEMDLRLEEQFELAALGGVHEFGLQREARFQLLPDRILERYIAAALDGLGAVEGDMAVAEQFVRGAAAGGMNRRADGNLDAMRTARRKNRLLEGATDTLSEAGNGFGGVGAT